MGNRAITDQITLLPHYCKKIGLITSLLFGIAAFVFKLVTRHSAWPEKELFLVLIADGIILGMILIAWSKDKIEDELTVALRLKSVVLTFAYTVLMVIINSAEGLTDKAFPGILDDQVLILFMLLMYIVMYYSQKRRL